MKCITNTTKIYTSTDNGTTWNMTVTSRNIPTTLLWDFVNNTWIIIYKFHNCYTSPNATTWTFFMSFPFQTKIKQIWIPSDERYDLIVFNRAADKDNPSYRTNVLAKSGISLNWTNNMPAGSVNKFAQPVIEVARDYTNRVNTNEAVFRAGYVTAATQIGDSNAANFLQYKEQRLNYITNGYSMNGNLLPGGNPPGIQSLPGSAVLDFPTTTAFLSNFDQFSGGGISDIASNKDRIVAAGYLHFYGPTATAPILFTSINCQTWAPLTSLQAFLGRTLGYMDYTLVNNSYNYVVKIFQVFWGVNIWIISMMEYPFMVYSPDLLFWGACTGEIHSLTIQYYGAFTTTGSFVNARTTGESGTGTLPGLSAPLRDISYNGKIYSGISVNNTPNSKYRVFYSYDGIDWTNNTSIPNNFLATSHATNIPYEKSAIIRVGYPIPSIQYRPYISKVLSAISITLLGEIATAVDGKSFKYTIKDLGNTPLPFDMTSNPLQSFVTNGKVALIMTNSKNTLTNILNNTISCSLLAVNIENRSTTNNWTWVNYKAGAGLPIPTLGSSDTAFCWDPYNNMFICMITSVWDMIFTNASPTILFYVSKDNGMSWTPKTISYASWDRDTSQTRFTLTGRPWPNSSTTLLLQGQGSQSYTPVCVQVGKDVNGNVMYIAAIRVSTTITAGYSYDLTNWTKYPSATITTMGVIFRIAYNGSIWLCSSTNSNIAYSYNGINWIATTRAERYVNFAWNGSIWVGVGGDGVLTSSIYSYNGINWFRCNTNNVPTYNNSKFYIDVKFNGEYFVFYPSTSTLNSEASTTIHPNIILYSYDGITIDVDQTRLTLDTLNAYRIIPFYPLPPYLNVPMVTSGPVGPSPIGPTGLTGWTGWPGEGFAGNTGPTGIYSATTISKNMTLCVGTGGVYSSYDGVTWIQISKRPISNIAYNGTMWVAASVAPLAMYWSLNGSTWTAATITGASIIKTNSLGWDYINSIWYVIAFTASNSFLYVSTSGYAWTSLNPSVTPANSWLSIHQLQIPRTNEIRLFVTYGGVAAAYPVPFVSVRSLYDLGVLQVTQTFSSAYPTGMLPVIMATNGNLIILALAYYSGSWGTNKNILYSSTDGVSWTANTNLSINTGTTSTVRYPYGIDTLNIFSTTTVAANNYLNLMTNENVGFNALIFENGIWVASLTMSISMIYSYDGSLWYPCRGDVVTYNPRIGSILYNGTVFMGIVYTGSNYIWANANTNTLTRASSDSRYTYTSTDGINWVTDLLPIPTASGRIPTDAGIVSAASSAFTVGPNGAKATFQQNQIVSYTPNTYAREFWAFSSMNVHLTQNGNFTGSTGFGSKTIYSTSFSNVAAITIPSPPSLYSATDGNVAIQYGSNSLFYVYTSDLGNSWNSSASLFVSVPSKSILLSIVGLYLYILVCNYTI